jgi:hypothetical protein
VKQNDEETKMSIPESRGRTGRHLVLAALLGVGLGACAPTVRIRDLLDQPQRYDGRTVKVEGTVTQSAGLLGIGAYQVDDGTGSIYVIAQGQGVPREGGRTSAKGRFESVFSLAGRTIAAIVQGRDSP